MRQYQGVMSGIARGWGVLTSLYCLLYASGILMRFGVYVADLQNSAIVLGAVLVNTFLLLPSIKSSPKNRLPWYDAMLALVSLAACGYMIYFYVLPPGVLNLRIGAANTLEIILGLLLLTAMFEAGRRTVGLPMVLIAFLFLLYFFLANRAPGFLQGYSIDLSRGMALLYLSSEGIWGTPMSVAATIIVIFLIFGRFLELGGAGQFYTDLASSLLGHVRGGPAKVAVIGSALFGMISGSNAANAATVGSITIPLMKSLGYKAEFAGAVEAVTSNGGQIMPPVMGVVAFIMADWLGISYWEVCVSSFVPAFLYYFVEFTQVDLEAAKRGLVGLPRESIPRLGPILKSGWYFLMPPIALIFFLAVLGYSPQTAAIYSLAILVVLSFIRREKRNARWIAESLHSSAPGMNMVVPSCAVAGIIIASVILTGFGFKFSSILVNLAGGNLFLLLIFTAVASFILGMGMVSLVCYIVVAVLVAPALITLGVLPLAAHLFVFWWGLTAFITPPVAIGVFITSGIAKADVWKTGWQAVRLGIVTFIVPFAFVYQPGLLLKGSPEALIWGIVSTLLACFGLACGLSGYILKPTNLIERALMFIGAILLLIPFWQFSIPGVVAIALPILYQMRALRSSKSLGREGKGSLKELT